MKRILLAGTLTLLLFWACFPLIWGQDSLVGTADVASLEQLLIDEPSLEQDGIHQAIKTKFIEGSALFMSIIAGCLIVGLAFCLERIIYLNLAQVNTGRMLRQVEEHLASDDLEGALDLARDTRGPVASICYQALLRSKEEVETIDRSITAYGSVQVGLLEKNLSWITLFIAVAPSLGFLGTVLGMIQSFDRIQEFGDINPSIVAGGMKFALITTVAGLIVAIILQFFYNYILNKVEGITGQMEDDSIRILDLVIHYKRRTGA
ncbi:MotA/TolQ/ExbB proton channel family protein [Bacteroidales bacterium OttesenSCG-928-L03]|nr:MotA/TolQ/ExbB proton channel family protein [Bacteroidales bacterium OttesenSCG-928-L03]